MIDSLDAPSVSGHCARWVEGTNIAFGFVESPPGHVEEGKRSAHEIFLYVIAGELDARVGKKKQKVGAGDVIHVPRGAAYGWSVRKGGAVRYAAVRSTPRLEAAIRKHGAADNWRG
jgi:quercetin dioxygenase-like cupin family protein